MATYPKYKGTADPVFQIGKESDNPVKIRSNSGDTEFIDDAENDWVKLKYLISSSGIQLYQNVPGGL